MEKKSGRRTRAAPKKKKSVGKKVIAWVLIILLIVAAGLIGGYFLLRDQGVTYYVEYGGDRYYANSDGGNISLSRGENKFIVKSITGKEVNYSAKVISNEASNFGFFVGEEFHRFYDNDEQNNDYTDVFGLEKNASEFTVTIPKDLTIIGAIEAKFGEEIILQSQIQAGYSYFTIEVKAEESAVSLRFTFNVPITGIEIDPPSIIF